MPIHIPTSPLFLEMDDHPLSRLEYHYLTAHLPKSCLGNDPNAPKLSLKKGVLSLTPKIGPILCIDFTQPPYRHALKDGKPSPLARACGHLHHNLKVLDTTAGVGQDAFQLASLGCKVVALERDVLIHALLSNAWRRISHLHPHLHLDIQLTSAFDYLRSPKDFDVIIIDPMFEHAKVHALAQKNKQALRSVLPKDKPNWQLWFDLAKASAKRIIIKQHAKSPPLALPKSTFVHKSKAMTLDVWVFP